MTEIEAMPVAEFRAWVAYYAEEPFGDVRADLRSGVVAAVVARTMGGNKRAKPLDFMPVVRATRDADEAGAVTSAARSAIIRQAFEGNLGGSKVRRAKIRRKG